MDEEQSDRRPAHEILEEVIGLDPRRARLFDIAAIFCAGMKIPAGHDELLAAITAAEETWGPTWPHSFSVMRATVQAEKDRVEAEAKKAAEGDGDKPADE